VRGGRSFVRTAALAALVAAVAAIAIVALGGGGGYRVTATFENAGQLVVGNQVWAGGRPVGEITDIGLTDDGRARVEMRIDDDSILPLRRGTRARIRAASLSGIANRYVELTLGPGTAPTLPDGAAIPPDRTQAPVDLDQVLNALDERTRQGLRALIRGSGAWYAGRAREADAATRYFAPALQATTRLTAELVRDSQTFERFLRDASRAVGAIAERRDELSQLVANANATATAIASRNRDLDAALAELPGTLRQANSTFVDLRSTLDDLDVLVAASKPATRRLAPFFQELLPLVVDARPAIADLSALVSSPGADNDLIDLVARSPRLADLTDVVFPRTIRTLNRSLEVVDYARLYTPDLAAWFTKFGAVAANYDANGHYARVQPIFSRFRLNGNQLELRPRTDNLLDAFQPGRYRRCPGASVQRPPDGSAPLSAPGCDPSAVPPGP
jgi:phospholipid/cholesterol/gamma-HCH transport system substrate-binding protein